MASLRDRHAAHRAACAEAVAEIAKHDIPLAKSAARVLGVSMPAPNTSAFLAELQARQRRARRMTLVWLAVSIAIAALHAWFAAPNLAAWSQGHPPITGENDD